MQISKIVVVAVILLSTATSIGFGQKALDPGVQFTQPASLDYGARPPRSRPAASSIPGYFGKQDKLQGKVNQKIAEYKAAEVAKKKEIEAELRILLSDQFDSRLKQPMNRISEFKKKIQQLSVQLENRNEKSEEIIDLRVKVLTNHSDGLGWHTASYPMANSNLFSSAPRWRPAGAPAGIPEFPASDPNKVDTKTYSNSAGIPGVGSSVNTQTPYYSGAAQPLVASNTASGLSKTRVPRIDSPAAQQQLLLSIYSKSKDKSEKKEIVAKIRKSLSDEFENHQKSISKSIETIQKQIQELESNLEKRKESKKEIVDLKLKTLINQANGLGF